MTGLSGTGRLRRARPLARLSMLLCAVSLLAPTAHAQSGDAVKIAKGQALYDEASKDMDAHRYDQACPKLEEVTRLVVEGIGARITLAECYEAQGRLASAWARYREAQAKAQSAGQGDREKKARQRAEALEGKLAKLSVMVPPAVAKLPNLVVLRDGEPVDPALWNSPLPIDKGVHQLKGQATGKSEWTASVTVKADGERHSVEVGPFVDAPGAEAAPPADSSAGEPSAPQLMDPPPAANQPYYNSLAYPPSMTPTGNTVNLDPGGRMILGIVLGTVGIGAAVGGVFLAKAGYDKKDQLYNELRCSEIDGRCDSDFSQSTYDSAVTNTQLGIGLTIGGGIVAVLGVVVLVTTNSYVAPSKDPKKARRGGGLDSVGIFMGPGRLGLTGSW